MKADLKGIFALILGVSMLAGCWQPSSFSTSTTSYDQQMQQSKEQLDKAAEQQRQYDEQAQRAKEALDRQVEQADRLDRILAKWEEQQRRYDAILATWEKQKTAQ